MNWAYGVTTVPSRLETLLPRTIKSLRLAGFDQPRLFIDGLNPKGVSAYDHFALSVTHRHPPVKCYANWVLSLWELYARNPICEYYAIFQDDFVVVKNLREYLERSLPKQSPFHYFNLITFAVNERVTRGGQHDPTGKWVSDGTLKPPGWYETPIMRSGNGTLEHPGRLQYGIGAVGLIFPRDGVQVLLSHRHIVDRPTHASVKSTCNVDGAIVTAMNYSSWREMVHNPSLLLHTGEQTTITDGKSISNMPHQPALTFPGEQMDAMEFLK